LIETIKNAQSEAEASGKKRTVAELGSVLSEAQSAYQEISGRDEVSELPLFYDLRLVTSDFISSLATSADALSLFVDDEKKQGIVLNTQTKQVFKIDLSSVAQVKSVGAFQTNQVVLLANGVYTLDMTEGAAPVVVKEEGDSNRGATLTASFGSYIYVFNPEKRNIYRYIKEGDAYSDPVGWLLDPLGVSFDSVVSWSIDGDIWMGTEGGQILRFASGRVEDYTIVGLPDSFSSSLQVVTRENLDSIYVLEPAKNRLVVLTKEGQFLREIKSSSLGAATSLLVDPSGTKAYVVSGSTVFELDV
jgi:DNA-binding beta-propeller fold protein YncE